LYRADRFEGSVIPADLRENAVSADPNAAPKSVSETVAVDSATQAVQARPGAQVAQEASSNVQSLQRRASGVLPVRIDVPRAGTSHRFVKPVVLDEEVTLSFRYRQN